MSLCSIIVVTHNNLQYTRQCLESIMSTTDYHPFELIAVDAHSTDGTLEYLHSNPEVKLLRLDKNYPFSYSLNRGIQAAKGEYLCSMNNDTVVVQRDWLKKLVECLQNDDRIGIVGPRLCNQDLSVTRTGALTENQLPRYILPSGKHVPIWSPDNSMIPCTYVVGACLAFRRQLTDLIGLFDEEFFFAYDETDYCMRTWKAGKRVVCNTWCKVVHLKSKTTKSVTEKDYEYDVHKYENPEKRFYRKYSPRGKYSSRDFELVIKQAKGPIRFYLWKTQYVVGQGADFVHKQGFRAFLGKILERAR